MTLWNGTVSSEYGWFQTVDPIFVPMRAWLIIATPWSLHSMSVLMFFTSASSMAKAPATDFLGGPIGGWNNTFKKSLYIVLLIWWLLTHKAVLKWWKMILLARGLLWTSLILGTHGQLAGSPSNALVWKSPAHILCRQYPATTQLLVLLCGTTFSPISLLPKR